MTVSRTYPANWSKPRRATHHCLGAHVGFSDSMQQLQDLNSISFEPCSHSLHWSPSCVHKRWAGAAKFFDEVLPSPQKSDQISQSSDKCVVTQLLILRLHHRSPHQTRRMWQPNRWKSRKRGSLTNTFLPRELKNFAIAFRHRWSSPPFLASHNVIFPKVCPSNSERWLGKGSRCS